MRWKTHAGVGVLTLALAAIPWAEPAVGAAAQQAEGDQVGRRRGFLRVFGRAGESETRQDPNRRNDDRRNPGVGESSRRAPAAVVPAGTTDLFNVAFSAEGRLFNGGGDDYVRIRVLDNGVPIEPYDAAQGFFSADAYATHAGHWAKRVAGGQPHVDRCSSGFSTEFRSRLCQARIDDWTFEVVVYD